jgi:hypothetical protein
MWNRPGLSRAEPKVPECILLVVFLYISAAYLLRCCTLGASRHDVLGLQTELISGSRYIRTAAEALAIQSNWKFMRMPSSRSSFSGD